jgi:hypothetical protein
MILMYEVSSLPQGGVLIRFPYNRLKVYNVRAIGRNPQPGLSNKKRISLIK